MKIINQPPVKLLSQTPKEVKQSFIELGEKNIRYCVEMTADQWKDMDDESMGREEAPIYFDRYALKKNIAGIEKSWNIKAKKWVIYISIIGIAEDWRLYYNKQTDCDAMLQELLEYL